MKGQIDLLLDFINLKDGKEVMYLRLSNRIAEAARDGVIKKGEKLPSIREAAHQLSVSRTTVENAYLKLCIEGIAESRPQRGYFVCGVPREVPPKNNSAEDNRSIKYDFSGRGIDAAAADTDFWKKTVREVLRDTEELTTYGDPQGERGLREALAAYTYKARGVRTNADNIVVGAGIGPLLCILCGITEKKTAAFEGIGFEQAKQIFSDYGIKTLQLPCDKNGVKPDALEESGADTLFLQPSLLSKISVTELSARRNKLVLWAGKKENRLIIEDDYNGELRYTARTASAFQGKLPDNTVYIGSFSKLLLPSVRIAYMVLPDGVAEKFRRRMGVYNQTCGKVEQLALKSYIESGALEKHLKRLRKLYYRKSLVLTDELKKAFPNAEITHYESSLTLSVKFKETDSAEAIYKSALSRGIKLAAAKSGNEVRLCFAGIPENDIPSAVNALALCRNC